MATAPIFYTTQRAEAATINTANSNRDGTGTLGAVLLAGGSGTKIERIIVQALGTTSAGMVRLYINLSLFDEVVVTAITPSASIACFHAERDFSLPGSLLILPTGSTLRASTHNAEAFNVWAIGADA